MSRHRLWCMGLAALAVPFAALATPWTVCDYTVRVRHIDAGSRTISVTLLRQHPTRAEGCMPAGGDMTFRPGSADGQSELPRRLWPAVGQRATLRHRYLDGMCKEQGPCRIERHALRGLP